MAFKLECFGSEVANIKSILGGIRCFTYNNDATPAGAGGDTITTAGYFPAKLGLKEGDYIIVKEDGEAVLQQYYVSNITDGVVTVTLAEPSE